MEKSYKHKHLAIGLGLIAIAIIIIVLIINFSPEFSSEIQPNGGLTKNIEQDGLPSYYVYSGNIDVKTKQNCTAIGSYYVKQFYVKEGDYVHRGDLLYTLDDSDISDSIAQAAAGVEVARVNYEKAATSAQSQANAGAETALESATLAYNDAAANLDRMLVLYNSGAISQVALEQAQTAFNNAKLQYESAQRNHGTTTLSAAQSAQAAKAQYDQARAGYEVAKTQLDKRKVTAEIDGIVSDVFAYENSTLTMGQRIMDVIDYGSLILEIKVDQFEVSMFNVGDPIEIYVHALGSSVSGVVSKISNQAIKTGEVSSFIVTIDIEERDDIKIGLLAEVKILHD